MSFKTVSHVWCEPCNKRGFEDEHDAEKALGRARARRERWADQNNPASRRGMKRENRIYECPEGLLHLTEQSRRVHNSRAERWSEVAA
ncbi:hypothetical protein [Lentzea sp. CC55]|uniref:hypothetical protein n=1 Tax=Lentzea sp. CC55 TaxID=2884909 RepID=UPI001F35EBB5|nr:hypothetical protein [Lentzea sp. CC55]MCG8926618.1 hypothetical protein [Lentzea sp. CC55]